MNNTKLTIWRYATTFAITFLSLASLAFAQSNVKMSNGDYQPGAVLVYQNGSLDVAVPSKIDRSETSYVLIHGAHTDSTNENIKKLARAIAAEDSDANILIVDWAYWSKFNGDKLEKIAGEQFELFVVEVFIRALFQDDVDMNEVIERHLSALFTRVFFNILPVEQTKWIPTVSERAYAILYGDTGDTWEFKTNGQTGSFVSLGLDPRKTRIIGHSHGAHVGGLVAARTRDKLGKMVNA